LRPDPLSLGLVLGALQTLLQEPDAGGSRAEPLASALHQHLDGSSHRGQPTAAVEPLRPVGWALPPDNLFAVLSHAASTRAGWAAPARVAPTASRGGEPPPRPPPVAPAPG